MLFLLPFCNALNWQGTGTFTSDNRTIIWNYINANFSQDWAHSRITSSADTTLANFSSAFSTELNRLWDPAWNVVVVYISDGTNSDSVVFGYAFRDHWMWYNGYPTNDGYYVSFIIWKDYNCITWGTINSNVLDKGNGGEATTFNATSTIVVNQFLANYYSSTPEPDYNSVEIAAFNLIPYLMVYH
jgi:hypothetical protein